MANNDIELTKQQLIDLNEQIVETEQTISAMEEKEKKAALKFFDELLSDQLIFRRASGAVVGKFEPEGGFMGSLEKASPFKDRVSEDIKVTLIEDRALVTLFVVGTKSDGTVGRYRNIRMFSRFGDDWVLEFWYNYEVTSL